MTNTQLDGMPVWAQWRTRKRRARAKLKALQLMATSGVIRPIHVELRHATSAHRISTSSHSSQESSFSDNAVTHTAAPATGSDSRQEWRIPLIQRFRAVSEGMLRIQRRLLAELQWGPDKAA